MKILALLALAFTITLPTQNSWAEKEVTIQNAWARATTSAIRTSAVYATLHNNTSETLVLTQAASPVSRKVELHSNTTGEFGQMMMHPVEALHIPAGGEAVFAPGGYHIMLVGLESPLVVGHEIPVTLTFKNGHTRTFRAMVQPMSFRGYSE
jgi:hypothetical protein